MSEVVASGRGLLALRDRLRTMRAEAVERLAGSRRARSRCSAMFACHYHDDNFAVALAAEAAGDSSAAPRWR